MPTSLYMPDVKVEIAFNANYTTASSARTWTDVSQWVELEDKIEITYGRDDQFATTEPNRLKLVLDNSDGRFTAKRAASPYSPNVKIGRPIRVTATPVGQAASVRFLGFVDDWPLEWSGGTTRHAKAALTATSRMARLGVGYELQSLSRNTAIDGGATYYFPLDGATEVARQDALESGAVLRAVGTGVQFGEEGATFDGTPTLLEARLPTPVMLSGGYAVGVAVRFADGDADQSSGGYSYPLTLGGNQRSISVLLRSDHRAVIVSEITWNTGTTAATSQIDIPFLAPDVWHTFWLQVAWDNTAARYLARLYIDDVLITDGPSAGVGGTYLNLLGLGNNGFKGTMTEVGIFGTAPSAALRTSWSAAVRTGFAGETAGARLTRLAESFAANLPADTYSFEAGWPVEATPSKGRNLIEVMREVEAAERGVLHDGRDGRLLYYRRFRRYNTTAAVTLDVNSQEVGALGPRLDKSQLVNEASITAASGRTFTASDSASIAEYGPARQAETLALADDQAEALAGHIVATQHEPGVRIPDMSLDLLAFDGAGQKAILDLVIGSRIGLTSMPSQAHATTPTFFVEGATETIGPTSYTFDLNVTPTEGSDGFTLDHATRGALNNPTYTIVY